MIDAHMCAISLRVMDTNVKAVLFLSQVCHHYMMGAFMMLYMFR